jgi:hypothetical protein
MANLRIGIVIEIVKRDANGVTHLRVQCLDAQQRPVDEVTWASCFINVAAGDKVLLAPTGDREVPFEVVDLVTGLDVLAREETSHESNIHIA